MTVNLIHAAFRRGIADVEAATDRLEQDKTAIDMTVRGFLESGWTGVAAESFVAAWEDWKDAADAVEDGLLAMGQLMDAAHRDLVVRDDASQRQLDGVSAQIISRLG